MGSRMPDRPIIPKPVAPRPPADADPDAIASFHSANESWLAGLNLTRAVVIHDQFLARNPPQRILDARGRWFELLGEELRPGTAPSTLRFGFELVARTVVDAGAGPAHFLVWPSVVDANFHEAGAEKVPEVGGFSLTGYPTLTATTTKRGVYAKVKLTYNEDYEVRLVGDWDVEQHVNKPAETSLAINPAGVVTNGVYYRRIGTSQMVEGALVLEQDRIGPWSAAWCPGSNWLEVRSPAWALTSMVDGGSEA